MWVILKSEGGKRMFACTCGSGSEKEEAVNRDFGMNYQTTRKVSAQNDDINHRGFKCNGRKYLTSVKVEV